MKKIMKGLITILIVFFFAAPSIAFTLRPQWVPQAQFAGYYMAVEKGFYKNAGINLEIKDGGPQIVGLQEVANGETDFATGWLISALRMRANGAKLILIDQFIQKPALMLIAKKSSGIDSLDKFSSHSLGVWPADFQVPPKALLRKYNIRDVRIINQNFTMDDFLNGKIDIASAMRYNEYHQVLEAGVRAKELNIFNYSDMGLNLPEDGVYVHKNFLKKNPEACAKLVEASLKGWKYAFAHKDETVKLMTQLANQTVFKTTESRQRTMLDEMESIIDLNSTKLKKKDFQTALDVLKSTRIIRKDIPYDQFAWSKGLGNKI